MKIYKASFGRVEEVEAVKVNPASVFIKVGNMTRRLARESSYECYNESREFVINFMIRKATKRVEDAKRDLGYAEEELQKIIDKFHQ